MKIGVSGNSMGMYFFLSFFVFKLTMVKITTCRGPSRGPSTQADLGLMPSLWLQKYYLKDSNNVHESVELILQLNLLLATKQLRTAAVTKKGIIVSCLIILF